MRQKKIIHLALSGSGRMGQALQELIQKPQSGFVLNFSWPGRKVLYDKKIPVSQIDGVIDFSAPLFFEKILKWSYKHKKPFVSGTTGLYARHKQLLRTVSRDIPVFYEENMSWGIWLIKNWLGTVSYPDISIKLEETHHRHKKDKPSGTALKLKRSFPVLQQKKVKIMSHRKGQELGTHCIYLKTTEEMITLKHEALSRRLFAMGALKAMKWLVLQAPGFYNLDDMHT